jgi:hypothetical protein
MPIFAPHSRQPLQRVFLITPPLAIIFFRHDCIGHIIAASAAASFSARAPFHSAISPHADDAGYAGFAFAAPPFTSADASQIAAFDML